MAAFQTLDQKRAVYAWERIHALGGRESGYRNLAKGAPALLMANGLMQTLAFYSSRKSEAGDVLAEHVCSWLATQVLGSGPGGVRDVMGQLAKSNALTYRRATEEAFEVLRWIRQFADALIKKEK